MVYGLWAPEGSTFSDSGLKRLGRLSHGLNSREMSGVE